MNNRFSSLFMVYALARTAIVVAVVLLLLGQFVLTATRVNGQSMAPTLVNRQMVLLDRFSVRWDTIKRGDIVSVRFPGDPAKTKYLKRVIGLPGEEVAIAQHKITINAQPLTESYLDQTVKTDQAGTWKLGADEYFVLGDNRTVSNDSRAFGPVEKRFFYGIARFILAPLPSMGLIEPVFY